MPESQQFNAVTVLINQFLGVAAQYAAGAELGTHLDRDAFLAGVAADWVGTGGQRPFVQRVVGELSRHAERTQYLAGIDLLLIGIGSTVQ